MLNKILQIKKKLNTTLRNLILDSFYDTTMKELKKTHIHVQDVTFDIRIWICISLIILTKIELIKNCIVSSVTVFSYKDHM